MNLREILETSLSEARHTRIETASMIQLHRARSRVWVDTLAKQFQRCFERDSAVRVFWRDNPEHRKHFRVNELLHDILICQVGTVQSAMHKKDLLYIKDVLWQVESEFARDSRQALIDFNKLVLGSGRSKLFVGPQVNDNQSFIDVLRPAANVCTGNVYVALVPHPKDWDKPAYRIDIWAYANGQWSILEPE